MIEVMLDGAGGRQAGERAEFTDRRRVTPVVYVRVDALHHLIEAFVDGPAVGLHPSGLIERRFGVNPRFELSLRLKDFLNRGPTRRGCRSLSYQLVTARTPNGENNRYNSSEVGGCWG